LIPARRKEEFSMKLARMAVVLAVASLAARLYLEIRRRGAVTGSGAGVAAPPAPAQGVVVRAVTGAGSPDDALLLGPHGFAENPPR
jgi:hypothetical protein